MGVTAAEVNQVQDGQEQEKPTSQIMFTVPNELKDLIESKAKEEGKSVSGLMRELVADEFDFTLPDIIRTRVSKYATPEERKAAQAAKAKQKNALVAKLLELYKSGAIELDDDED